MTSSVFNANKTIEDYQNESLLMGSDPGLFDTIHRRHPKIWSLYKEMKSLDWSEDEFDYSQCNMDFKSCPKSVADMMIRTLMWQWEADSVASRSIISVVAPFISSSELWAAWQRVSDNEVIHAATYSEIVRMSFDDPKQVLQEILQLKETLFRLNAVTSVFDEVFKVSHEYALGLRENNQDTYNYAFLIAATMLMLERIQFMASFAVTFTICASGVFQPIGKAVQKIAQDELEVHAELDKAIITHEMTTDRGKKARELMDARIHQIFENIIESEFAWVDYLFSEGRTLVGANADLLKQWVLFNAKDVAKFLNLKTNYKFPKHNPMPLLENWININKQQAAPQEQDIAAYKVGTTISDDQGVKFDFDF